MSDKVCVVTGASTGIGREVAQGFARLGYRVLMVSRDPGRAAAALEQVKKFGPNVESIVADLSLVSEAKRVVKEVRARTQRLDVLVNNAATVPASKQLSSEGFESAFATNVLAPFVLSTGLEDLLVAAKPSRIVNFYGGNHRDIDFDNLQGEKSFDGWAAYGQTKICDALLTGEFARKLEGKGITVNAAWPGIVNTEGMRAIPGPMKWFSLFMRPFMRPAEAGGKTPLWVSTAPELNGVTGKVFGTMFGDGKKEVALPPAAVDRGNAEKLYGICEKLTS